jgi:hypothetical protein
LVPRQYQRARDGRAKPTGPYPHAAFQTTTRFSLFDKNRPPTEIGTLGLQKPRRASPAVAVLVCRLRTNTARKTTPHD